MRCRIDLALIASGLCACGDATGSLEGGQQLALAPISASGAASGASGSGNGGSGSGSSGAVAPPATWTYLYDTYFGQITSDDGGTSYGLAACGLAISCHQLATDPGAINTPPKPSSGFVCGTTANECYQGMLNATPPLVSASDGGTADPTMAPLYQALWNGSTPGNCGEGVCKNNMPFTLAYQFSPSDLALIAKWIQNGAPNN
jgi:hypothetical protein